VPFSFGTGVRASSSARCRPVEAGLDRVAVGGRRRLHVGEVGERDEAEPEVVGQLVGQLLGRVDGRREAVGVDVLRVHRARRVGDHHHRGRALRRGDRALRPRQRDHERAQR
jgi:hypothetical protein